MLKRGVFIVMSMLMGCQPSQETAKADVFAVSGENTGQQIGYVTFTDTPQGIRVKTNLHNLPSGEHGFHIHEYPNCRAGTDADGNVIPAQAAGGHFDPDKTGKHLGPDGHGHKGDMPALDVAADGTADTEFYLHNITVKDIRNRSIIIHAGGDNYKDEPLPLGGGGARIACGIIE